jgi:hypothetical protein
MAPPDQFAAVELFRGTLQRHSVIVYRDDSPLAPLDRDDWGSFVPIRPDTVISVEERLPENVAAVLINQAMLWLPGSWTPRSTSTGTAI